MPNEIKYVGRIAFTPEWKDISGGLLNLTIAETHQRKNKQSGEWEDYSTTWHRVTVWGDNAAEYAANPQVNKGALVDVSARYESASEPYTNKQGEKVVSFNETANFISVKYPPKETQPAVKPTGADGFIPEDGFAGGF